MGKDLFTLRGRLMKEIFIPNIINKVKLVAPRIGVQGEKNQVSKLLFKGFKISIAIKSGSNHIAM